MGKKKLYRSLPSYGPTKKNQWKVVEHTWHERKVERILRVNELSRMGVGVCKGIVGVLIKTRDEWDEPYGNLLVVMLISNYNNKNFGWNYSL